MGKGKGRGVQLGWLKKESGRQLYHYAIIKSLYQVAVRTQTRGTPSGVLSNRNIM